MSNNKRFHVQNFFTISATTVPEEVANDTKYGEIVVMANKDNEKLVIKNSDNEIVSFVSEKKVNELLNNIKNDLIPITYNELKTLKENGNLKAGSFYRIVDYVTIVDEKPNYGTSDGTNSDGIEPLIQLNSSSANKPFDLIVFAISENTLSNKASAVLHDGDTYFSQSKLNKWEIWYTIDNKYEGGKGFIYKMIDEFGNECPYDFKNTLFDGMYTFGKDYDDSLMGGSKNNKIYGEKIIMGYDCSDNTIGVGSRRIRMGNNCVGNTFGNNCRGITLGSYCSANTFGNNCIYSLDDTFGTIGGGIWKSGDEPRNYCNYNVFDNGCMPKVESATTSGYGHSLNHLHITIEGSYCGFTSDGESGVFETKVFLPNTTPLNSVSEVRVGMDSNGNLKIFRIEDILQ